MTNTYIISDTHFGHNNIHKYSPCRGAKDVNHHTEILINNWNKTVRKNDKVICLGDFAFGSQNISIAEKLNGYKILIMGNHDNYSTDKYTQYFNKLLGSMEYKGCILTHIPVHETQLKRYRLNIHGHLHDKNLNDHRYINVSCEQVNCTPILLNSITEN